MATTRYVYAGSATGRSNGRPFGRLHEMHMTRLIDQMTACQWIAPKDFQQTRTQEHFVGRQEEFEELRCPAKTKRDH
jgi:hypothetical protein